MKIRALLFTLSLLLLSISTRCVYGYNENVDGYSFIQQYEVSSNLDLSVSTVGGNLTAVVGEDNSAEVSFIVSLRGKLLDVTFDQLKDYAEVEIINSNSKLEINVKRIIKRNVGVGFFIKTPVNSSVDLKTSGGNIEVAGLTGQQKMKTSGGNIRIEQIIGTVVAKTSGGNISLDNIDGKVDVYTSGGNIKANNITKELIARTSGGNINLSKVQDQIDVSTSGGSIYLDEVSGSVKARTSGGNIKANIINLTDNLELKTSGGSINCIIPSGLGLDLDLSAFNIDTPLLNFTGTAKKNRIIGQVNGGGIKVNLSTSGGNVVLNYK